MRLRNSLLLGATLPLIALGAGDVGRLFTRAHNASHDQHSYCLLESERPWWEPRTLEEYELLQREGEGDAGMEALCRMRGESDCEM